MSPVFLQTRAVANSARLANGVELVGEHLCSLLCADKLVQKRLLFADGRRRPPLYTSA